MSKKRAMLVLMIAAGVLLLLSGVAMAEISPRTQSRSGVVDVLWEPEPKTPPWTGVDACAAYPCYTYYEVRRHSRTDSYNIGFTTWLCRVGIKWTSSTQWSIHGTPTCADNANDSVQVVQPDINSSRYIVVRDRGAGTTTSPVEDWQEYYYLVTQRHRGSATAAYQPFFLSGIADYKVVSAFPPNQTRHGSYTEFTGVCTNCHGLHSAQSSQKLLKGETVTDLCATCHDGTMSKYNVVEGTVFTGGAYNALAPAGPFGTQFVDNVPGSGAYGAASSVHNVFRAGSTTGAYVYMAPGTGFREISAVVGNSGSGNDFSPVGWTNQLSCISCHEPHNRPFNFRLLRNDIADRASGAGSHEGTLRVRGVSETGTMPAGDAKWPVAYTTHGAIVNNEVYLAQTKFFTGTAKFCSQCHRAFYNRSVRAADDRVLAKMFSLIGGVPETAKDLIRQYFRRVNALSDYWGTKTPADSSDDVTLVNAEPTGEEQVALNDYCKQCHGLIYEAGDGDCIITDYGYESASCFTSSPWGEPGSLIVYLGWAMGNQHLDKGSGALETAVMGSGHRHPTEVAARRVLASGKVVEGNLHADGYSVDQIQARVRPGPVHVGVPLEGVRSGSSYGGYSIIWEPNEYVSNDVVCLTCHMAHGSRTGVDDAADWTEWFTGDEGVGVAYLNIGMNGTTVSSIVYYGYYYNAPPDYNPATPPAGPSTVLARFAPAASICYRCHSTK